MKQYLVTYPVTLKNDGGGWCTSPLQIMRQMDAAQRDTLHKINTLISLELLDDQVGRVQGVKDKKEILITCSEQVAARIKAQDFIESVTPHTPALKRAAPAPSKPFKWK